MSDETDAGTDHLSVRIPTELMAKIKGLAEVGDRSTTKQVLRLLRIAVAIEESETRSAAGGGR